MGEADTRRPQKVVASEVQRGNVLVRLGKDWEVVGVMQTSKGSIAMTLYHHGEVRTEEDFRVVAPGSTCWVKR